MIFICKRNVFKINKSIIQKYNGKKQISKQTRDIG